MAAAMCGQAGPHRRPPALAIGFHEDQLRLIMRRSRAAGVLFVLVLHRPVPALQAQDVGWIRVESVDDLTGARDRRLILRAEGWPQLGHTAAPDAYKGATLVVSCGDRIPGDSGRSLLLFAGEPLQPFGGGEFAAADVWFGGDDGRHRYDMAILDRGDALVIPSGGRSTRHLAFLGERGHPYFSADFFRRLTASDTVRLEYLVFGQTRRVVFHTDGLQRQLSYLDRCPWPPSPGG